MWQIGFLQGNPVRFKVQICYYLHLGTTKTGREFRGVSKRNHTYHVLVLTPPNSGVQLQVTRVL